MNSIYKTSEKGGCVVLWKKEGETPLEAMEAFWIAQSLGEYKRTYAGRLDPMAEGKLLIVYGDEILNKDKYIDLEKEYEIDVVLGVSTDTGDVLGLITKTDNDELLNFCTALTHEVVVDKISTLVGKQTMEYPSFSSKTINGVQMHQLARADKGGGDALEIPTKEIEIKSIECLGVRTINSSILARESIERIEKVKGDFRQDEIRSSWENVTNISEDKSFVVLSLRVCATSGTYMRWLCSKVGELFGVGGYCNKIVRTKIFGVGE